MDLVEATHVVASMQAPNWLLYITHERGRDAVHVEQHVLDTYHEHGDAWVHDEWFWLDLDASPDQLRLAIYTRMQFRTLHELSEHVTVYGVPIYSQHLDPPSISRARQLLIREHLLAPTQETP